MENRSVTLILGDCIEKMRTLPDSSVDLVLTDLPYGTTTNKWDVLIPFGALWDQWLRIAKEAAPFITTASQPFTTDVINSARYLFRYELIWDKTKGGNFLLAKRMPMKRHENVLVFYRRQPTYNPQMEIRGKPRKKGGGKASSNFEGAIPTVSYNNEYYPTSIVVASTGSRKDHHHPTQKPVELMSYIVETYTNEGDTVLDCCMGSGTTGVACVQSKRAFIGIELNEEYFTVAEKRIAEASRDKVD
jgi:site-specific DNA-methyltransferase (adenine-specific)